MNFRRLQTSQIRRSLSDNKPINGEVETAKNIESDDNELFDLTPESLPANSIKISAMTSPSRGANKILKGCESPCSTKQLLSPPYCTSEESANKTTMIKNIEQNLFGQRTTSQARDNILTKIDKKLKTLLKRFDGIDELYDWQLDFICKYTESFSTNIICHLPTGAGKTIIALLTIIFEILVKKCNSILILPYVALAREKINSFAPYAIEYEFLIEEYAGGKGILPPKKRNKQKSLYVCTIEKGLMLIHSLIEAGRLKEVGLVVFDEFHFIGDENGRGAKLEETLTLLQYLKSNLRIIGLSATLDNFESLERFCKAKLFSASKRPISLDNYLIFNDSVYRIDANNFNEKIDEENIIKVDEDYKYLSTDWISWLVKTISSEKTLIFCPTKLNCENVAMNICARIKKEMKGTKALRVLIIKISKHIFEIFQSLSTPSTIRSPLVALLKFGIAFHHSNLSSEERSFIEDNFVSGLIHTLCCTSTLAAGINLPATQVIIRSPYIGKSILTRSRYIQMIGRAGRSGMADKGKSFILINNAKDMEKFLEVLGTDERICRSTLFEDNYLQNIILNTICLKVCESYSDLEKFISLTLNNIQESKQNLGTQVLDSIVKILRDKRLITIEDLPDDGDSCSKIYPTHLGKAAHKSNLSTEIIDNLINILETSLKTLNISSPFHIIYLITPTDIWFSMEIDKISSIISLLSKDEIETIERIGINMGRLFSRKQSISSAENKGKYMRLFNAMILYIYYAMPANFKKIENLCGIQYGEIEKLHNNACGFGSTLLKFCQELPEYKLFSEILRSFMQQFQVMCFENSELLFLLDLPHISLSRAKLFWAAGFTSIKQISEETSDTILSKIGKISRKHANDVIYASKLLIREKMNSLIEEIDNLKSTILIDSNQVDVGSKEGGLGKY